MRLTKSKLAALHTALSIDDVLFEKFRRLNEDLARREQAFRGRRQIARVFRKDGKIYHCLQILAVEESPTGLVVICQ